MQWRPIAFSLIILLSSACQNVAHAQIIINEVSPRSDPEWIEIYNQGSDPVDLTNWYFKDAAGNKKMLPATDPLLSSTYFVASGYTSWLNNTGDESVYLYNNLDTLVDSLSFGETKTNTTIARMPNLGNTWFVDQVPTPLSSNDLPSPTPSPTLIASPSPTPTPQTSPAAIAQTPSPTPTPPPSITPTPTPTPSPSPITSPTPKTTPFLTPSFTPTPITATVAGAIDLSSYGASPTPDASLVNSPIPRSLILNYTRLKNLLLPLLGLGLIAISIYFYKKRTSSV